MHNIYKPFGGICNSEICCYINIMRLFQNPNAARRNSSMKDIGFPIYKLIKSCVRANDSIHIPNIG